MAPRPAVLTAASPAVSGMDMVNRPAASPAVSGMDMVNHPPHYTHGEIECIDAMRAMLGHEGYIAYLRGTILKYNWRLLHKLHPVEDAQKMQWYQDRLERELELG